MKTIALRFLLVSLTLSLFLTLNARNAPDAPQLLPAGERAIDQVAAIVPANGDLVTRGVSRIMVSMRLGRPDIVLSDGNWLYRDYHFDEANATLGALIVRFTNNCVSSLSIANHQAVVAVRDTKTHFAKDQILAATQKR